MGPSQGGRAASGPVLQPESWAPSTSPFGPQGLAPFMAAPLTRPQCQAKALGQDASVPGRAGHHRPHPEVGAAEPHQPALASPCQRGALCCCSKGLLLPEPQIPFVTRARTGFCRPLPYLVLVGGQGQQSPHPCPSHPSTRLPFSEFPWNSPPPGYSRRGRFAGEERGSRKPPGADAQGDTQPPRAALPFPLAGTCLGLGGAQEAREGWQTQTHC